MSFRRVAAILVLAAAVSTAFAQEAINLAPLNEDVNTLFNSVGRDVVPSLNALARSGDVIVGAAELRGFSGAYLTVLGVNIASMDGLGGVLGDTSTETWKFELLPIPTLLANALGTGETADMIQALTTQAMGLPAIRLGLGFPVYAGFEVLMNGFYLPPALVTWGVGMAGADTAAMIEDLGLAVDMLSAGITVRKVILSERKATWRPALSIGLGYDYASFGLDVPAFDLDALLDDPIDVGGLGTLSMTGNTSFNTAVHSAGITLAMSKTLLYVFRPFIKASAFYHHASYQSAFEVTAVVTLPDDGDPATDDFIEQSLSAPVTITRDDLSVFASAGIEFAFPILVITLAATVDMERPVLDIDSFDLGGFTLNGIGATVALRLQF